MLLWLDRRYRLGHGRVFWAYVGLYTLGRVWIEAVRIDDAERVLGLRLNIWTSIVLFAVAAAFLVLSTRRHPGPRALGLAAGAGAGGLRVRRGRRARGPAGRAGSARTDRPAP